MSKKKKKSEKPEKKQEKRSFLKKLGFLIAAGLIMLIALGLGIIYSGWFLAQSVRWPFTTTLAENITPLISPKARAPGYGIALSSNNEAVREAASRALDEIGPEAQAAIPKLLKSLKNREAEIRRSAIEALGNMGGKASETAPHLAGALRDKSAAVRASAAEALAKVRARADVALPALKEALNDTATNVREAAQAAIEKLREQRASPESEDEEE
ncbi:MAG: HEAT repeat domain-containing protein [Pseudomonadota bacterium]